jgi:hypothetical protein
MTARPPGARALTSSTRPDPCILKFSSLPQALMMDGGQQAINQEIPSAAGPKCRLVLFQFPLAFPYHDLRKTVISSCFPVPFPL